MRADREHTPLYPAMTGTENAEPRGSVVNEYREGRDKCIERQRGPGEDVSFLHVFCRT
jgi:hypothetical protein